MTATLDDTHDPALQSWVESANDQATDFPIQNLPFGRFRSPGSVEWHIGVAIGDKVLDLNKTQLVDTNDMNRLMSAGADARRGLRQKISAGLRRGSDQQASLQGALYSQSEVEMGLPCQIGDYTDFYTGIHHATTVGKLFRPDNPLMPNYKWVPIGYHGRASSIGVSGQTFRRPSGQTKGPDDPAPKLSPSRRMDYELELGIFVGKENTLGEPVSMAAAEEHVFGLALLNDWSARDIQAWEYQPLGPFLAKNFASTVSPWIVTMEALQPFRIPFQRPEDDPQPLPYLDSPMNRESGGVDIKLEVWLQTEGMRKAGLPAQRLSYSNFSDAYWTVSQLIAHHTVNGCNLQPGDLLGSGTISGAAGEQGGSLLELTMGGKQVITLSNGETRTFLEDGDTVILRAYCEKPGARRIGFGECKGTLLAARQQ
ncbi:fumarylacetoacetase [Noviherbaspirillum sp. Root189]|uniref:fumarylacetoacetase n=1 Tax=Noviherbaspirillum sp. Root189 TaxID=1736487 RepID=UPI00070AD448|nr:fumarylacetoacetase [Noviherbaspirillum sp. Root189]KRB85194.1 fumarylacetoacetase [Noviherbaspirillum sp. Root189]